MPHMLELLEKGQLYSSGILEHLAQMLREHEKTPLKGQFEVFSQYLRSSKFQFKEFQEDTRLAAKLSQARKNPTAALDLLHLKAGNPRPCVRPDTMLEYHALKTAGISVGEHNCFHLNKVLKVLSAQATSLRFWGKILGKKDYFVVQGLSTRPHAQTPNSEKGGVNRYSYWVANNVLHEWVELPAVTPQQVQASRQFKHIFSGDLERPISKGRFKGEQKHLLKCVVARITHSCQLAPKGVYKVNEENPLLVQFQQQVKVPQVGQMASLDNWVHYNQHILLQGRCTHYIDASLPQEQREAATAQLVEKDPMVERLKGISEDKPFEPYPTAWVASLCGESTPIAQRQEGQSQVYGVAVVRSVVWPGAAVVGYKGNWVNVYVGYGHRASQAFNAIRTLPDLQSEGPPREERAQPNPAQPKKEEVKEVKEELPAE